MKSETRLTYELAYSAIRQLGYQPCVFRHRILPQAVLAAEKSFEDRQKEFTGHVELNGGVPPSDLSDIPF